MSELILPNTKYIESVKKAHEEQFQHGEISKEVWDGILSDLSDPESYVRVILDKSNGIGLKLNQVPVTRYWLIDGDEYIGTLGLRKEITIEARNREGNIGYQIRPSKRGQGYGNVILKLGLQKAKEFGLENIYINCSENNTASKKIIENNGGELLSTSKDEVSGEKSLHYLIKII